MKIVGYRKKDQDAVTVGVLRDGFVRPLAPLEEFWSDAAGWVARAEHLESPEIDVTLVSVVPPVPDSARVICVGLNYKAHAAEGGFTPPPYPTLFGRWTPSLSVDGAPTPVPANEAGLDWEGEVAAFIGTRLESVDAATGQAGVLGYACFNDLTARKAQKLTAQWTLGKNGDRSGPLGPLVPAGEVGDLSAGLRVQTRVNGTVVQDGNTRDLIFPVGEIIALVSETFTLHPGDIIATGTPEGVGYVRNPPWLLGPGDIVEVEIDKLGVLRTPIVDASGRKGA
ncbi:fumarylacetoacetate hydrolase family protein [Rhodococcus sp. JVH1]|uniref:fumarylacetoacetate hydrolase family protein n=1 Tax=Rhodococcus sp. JVH1 TaxID=745408 RepID=UPI000271E07B|nr:fumarylacetoacetate hydrolase family protein [Rhodococcus sp. JVH1]EJI97444.1 fumarylacetoacetate (FAA) hydrolase family protein [Rhodococcus sp. JVH1]